MSGYDAAGRRIPERAAQVKKAVLASISASEAAIELPEPIEEMWPRLVYKALHQLDEMLGSTNHIERHLAVKLTLDHAARLNAIAAAMARPKQQGEGTLDFSRLEPAEIETFKGLLDKASTKNLVDTPVVQDASSPL